MRTTRLIIFLCTALLCRAQAGTIGVDPTSGETGYASGYGGMTLGWEFEVTAPEGITVDGLGFWDYQSNGFDFGQTFPVGLWDAATGNLLCSSAISTLSALKASLHPMGGWRVNPVAPVFLAPGLYRVGALMPESAANAIVTYAGAAQSAAGVSLVRYLRQLGSLTLAMPDLPMNDSADMNFGPTFTFTPGGTGPTGLAVAPRNYTAAAGTTGVNTLLRSSGYPRTYQMQFSAAALAGLPVGANIIELRFRLWSGVTAPFPSSTATWATYQVTLAQAVNPVSGMSATFAANMRSPVLVKSGTVSIPPNNFGISASLPNPFGSFIVFDTPYVYQGGDLVLFFRHTGNDASTFSYLDGLNSPTPGYGTDFRAFSTNSFTAGVGLDASVIIPEFVFTYSPRGSISRNGANVVVTGAGGPPGATYRLLASPNIGLPMSQWTGVATNKFDGSGSFRYTNAITPGLPAQFFRILLP